MAFHFVFRGPYTCKSVDNQIIPVLTFANLLAAQGELKNHLGPELGASNSFEFLDSIVNMCVVYQTSVTILDRN